MKRKREVERKTELKSAIEELSLLVSVKRNNNNIINFNDNIICKVHQSPTDPVAAHTCDDHLQQQQEFRVSYLSTRPFLSLCSLMLQVLDKIGPTMAVMRQDIYKNIHRLEMLCDSDPLKYSNLVEILEKEAIDGNAKKGDSCSKAFVWLTRSLEFTAALLKKLEAEPTESMEQIVGNSYETTLKPWHGWISVAAYKVALKLVPETDAFLSLLMDKDENVDTFRDEIKVFNSLLSLLLEDLHSILSSYGLERFKST